VPGHRGLGQAESGNQIDDPAAEHAGRTGYAAFAARPRRDMPGVLASGVIFLATSGLQEKARGSLNTVLTVLPVTTEDHLSGPAAVPIDRDRRSQLPWRL
jgi:hypothetical protein